MTRVLAQAFIGSKLNQIFEENRQLQYATSPRSKLLLRLLPMLPSTSATTSTKPTKSTQTNLPSRQSFYSRTRSIDPAVSEAIDWFKEVLLKLLDCIRFDRLVFGDRWMPYQNIRFELALLGKLYELLAWERTFIWTAANDYIRSAHDRLRFGKRNPPPARYN